MNRLVKHLRIIRGEKGFTYVDALVAVFILGGFSLFSFSVLGNAGEADYRVKEQRVVNSLVEPFIDYYKQLDVVESDVDGYVSEVTRVDLTEIADDTEVPEEVGERLRLTCEVDGELIDGIFVRFQIDCSRNGDAINRGNPYVLYKIISE